MLSHTNLTLICIRNSYILTMLTAILIYKLVVINLDPKLSLFVMSSAPAKKSAGDARYASKDPLTHYKSHKIWTQIGILPTSNAIKVIELEVCVEVDF